MKHLIFISHLILFTFCCFANLMAQTGSLDGVVTDSESGEPLPGVNIVLAEIEQGTFTNAEGEYTFENIPVGDYTLNASFVGYTTLEQAVTISSGSNSANIEMRPDILGLEDVVVTAFGIQREQRSIGYSSQNLTSQDISRVRESNFVNTLQGKISGVDITNAHGALGGSSRIILRGVSSLSGDNQPLFIVDGVYIDNSNFDSGSEFGNGADYGNAAMDINPNDIESINVLKGPNAAALYGSRASNGAIIITTKDGRGSDRDGIGVTFNSMVTFEDVSLLPDMQNEYGQGFNGEFAYVDGRGGGTFDGIDESWGPPLDGRMIPQFPDGEERPWVANPDNVRDYFNTGVSMNNNIALAGTFDDANFRLSLTDLRQDGIFPAEELDRNTVSLNSGIQLSEELRVDVRANYFKLRGYNRPSVGYADDNPMQQLTQWFGRQIDIDRLRDYEDDDGNPINWNYQYFDNPFWIQEKNGNRQERDRLIGNTTIRYDLANWISLTGMIGTDFYNERRSDWSATNTINDPDGRYYEDIRNLNILTANIRANIERSLSEDLYLDVSVGSELQNRNYQLNEGEAPGLSVPNVYSISNSSVRQNVDDFKSEKQTNSLFAAATLGFRDYLYLDVTGRNDWSSTLPSDNNSYFYPSASLSLIFTDAFDLQQDWLTYGKIRGGWTRVGNDTDPYQLRATYSSVSPFGDVPSFTLSNTLPNVDLRPESKESVELGTELRFLNDRLGLDLTLYHETTTDQILPVEISRASGYEEQVINAGELRNRGIEVSFNATPVQTPSLRWDMTVNWSKNNNEVVELVEDLDAMVLGSSWDVTVEARPGEEFGTLYGTSFLRDDEGNIIVDDDGLPMVDSEIRPFGSYQADWTGGIMNSFNFRGFELGFLIDMKYGGKLTSTTYMFGRYTGILEETLEGRGGGYVFDGGRWADGAVKQDGTPNDIETDAQTFNSTFFGNAESHIFDATYVKLRELRLSYALPVSVIENLPFRSAEVGFIGRNLWIIHKEAPHIDPETAFNAGEVQGLESNQFPAVRSLGFNVRFTL